MSAIDNLVRHPECADPIAIGDAASEVARAREAAAQLQARLDAIAAIIVKRAEEAQALPLGPRMTVDEMCQADVDAIQVLARGKPSRECARLVRKYGKEPK